MWAEESCMGVSKEKFGDLQDLDNEKFWWFINNKARG